MNSIFLKKNEERRLQAGHLWIYSNEIDTKISPLKNFQPGELITIKTAHHKNLGIGYINPNTLLSVRLLTRNPKEKINCDFFITKIRQAQTLRELCFAKPFYRLIFGESDQLPGLIVDRFGDILVAQLNTAGMENLKELIVEALVQVIKPSAILWRNSGSIRATENLTKYIEAAYGNPPTQIKIEENGLSFIAAIKEGQKTGWFYDQRNNRAHLAPYVKNKNVLDVFSYGGGFGINAARFGAKNITCIDTAELALNLVKQNAALNNVSNKITTICADAFQALKELHTERQLFDVIIFDPPAFIKKRKDIEIGTNAYLRLHHLALQILNPSGILITTSCSLHLSRDMLLDVIRKSSVQEKRNSIILEQLHQAEDHPIHPAIAETNYLKGFIVQVL